MENDIKDNSKKERKNCGEDSSDIWHLRQEHQVSSKALRSRKLSKSDDGKETGSKTKVDGMRSTFETSSINTAAGVVSIETTTDECSVNVEAKTSNTKRGAEKLNVKKNSTEESNIKTEITSNLEVEEKLSSLVKRTVQSLGVETGLKTSSLKTVPETFTGSTTATGAATVNTEATIPSVEPATNTSYIKATVEKANRLQRKPGLVHRKTDPCLMREFQSGNWSALSTLPSVGESVQKYEMLYADGLGSNDGKNKILNDERFLISSHYDLAKRRLSLPLSTLSKVEHTWNGPNAMFEDSDEADSISSHSLIKGSHRSSCAKQLHQSPNMEKKRRQSAWTRAASSDVYRDATKPLGKRRMSELPALSALATRRRSVPHTLSVPIGLRRKTSRATNSSDYQNLNSSCLKAKNEMLATLSMSSWSENASVKHHEVSRRKSCHTGFGIMALKKKEEKRLMVAHEILETEKNYIKALETLNEVFVEPMKKVCVVPEKDIRTMFPKQLLAMKNGHERFMNELNDRLNNWKWQGVLGDIFAKLGNSYHVDFMTVYSEYVDNFPKSIAVINKYTRNSQKFKRFLEKCTNDPRCQRLNISAFLLSPIQRLPRYVLLLRQLAKYTDPNHPDSFHIEISLEKMIDIINVLNSSIQNSTRVARSASTRRSSQRRRKRHLFKTKESANSELSTPRKSSDDSEWSEASGSSTPRAQRLSPLAIDSASPTIFEKSSDYGSMTNSETPSEPTSPSSSSSSRTGSFLKVILRSGSESKRSKRRPLSTTEVEIIRRKDFSQTLPKEELRRTASRDSIGSIIRHKVESLRRRPRSSEENLDTSFDRISDPLRATSAGNDSVLKDDDEVTECSKSDSDLLAENTPEGVNALVLKSDKPSLHEGLYSEELNSGSSMESCSEAREQFPVSGDSDDSTTYLDSQPTSRLEDDVTDNNNGVHRLKVSKQRRKQGLTGEPQLTRKKIGKRNSFTNAMKFFFVSKSRSSSASPDMVIDCASVAKDQLYGRRVPKDKLSTV